MKFSRSAVLLCLSLLSFPLDVSADSAKKTLSLNFDKRIGTDRHSAVPADKHRLKAKRSTDGTVSVDLLSLGGTFYVAEVEVGTPAQPLQLLIDTGSSDAWVMSESVSLCSGESDLVSTASAAQDAQSTGCIGGLFSESNSSSYKVNNSAPFKITYGDSSGATGYYATDVFTFGGASLDNFTFGVANASTATTPILGVGLRNLESSYQYYGWQYSNLPVALAEAGIIESPIYSLHLNSINESTGAIVFGGYDSSHYTGEMQTLPLVREDVGAGRTAMYYLSVALEGIGLSSGSESTNLTTSSPVGAALLDSGTTLAYLPSSVVKSIVSQYSATYDSSSSLYLASCSSGEDDTVDYYFDGIKISVPLKQMLLEITDTKGNSVKGKDGSDLCALGVYPSDSEVILGDAFLRAAYVVYDLANYQVAIAQAAYPSDSDSSSDNVEALGTAGVTGAASAERTYTAKADDTDATTASVNQAISTSSITTTSRASVSSAASSVILNDEANSCTILEVPTLSSCFGGLLCIAALLSFF